MGELICVRNRLCIVVIFFTYRSTRVQDVIQDLLRNCWTSEGV